MGDVKETTTEGDNTSIVADKAPHIKVAEIIKELIAFCRELRERTEYVSEPTTQELAPKFLQTEEDQTDEKVSFSRGMNPKSKSTFIHWNTKKWYVPGSGKKATARKSTGVRQRKKRKKTLL